MWNGAVMVRKSISFPRSCRKRQKVYRYLENIAYIGSLKDKWAMILDVNIYIVVERHAFYTLDIKSEVLFKKIYKPCLMHVLDGTLYFPFLYFVIYKAQMCYWWMEPSGNVHNAALNHWLHGDMLKEISKCIFQTHIWDWYLEHFL